MTMPDEPPLPFLSLLAWFILMLLKQEDTPILFVPTAALHTTRAVPAGPRRQLGFSYLSASSIIAVHGFLAADLWLRGPLRQDTGRNDGTCSAKEKGTKPAITPAWSAVLPTQADFEESMPLLWHEQTQQLLPPTVTDLVAKQSAKLEKDWATVWDVFGAGGGSEGATDAAATSSGPEHRQMQDGANRGKKRTVNGAP